MFLSEMNEHELFLAHYLELCKTLTDVENLLPHFVKAHIISANIHQEINAKVTLNQNVEALMRYISDSLESGNTEKFYTLLKIMEEHGNQATQGLAKQIWSKIGKITHQYCNTVTCRWKFIGLNSKLNLPINKISS